MATTREKEDEMSEREESLKETADEADVEAHKKIRFETDEPDAEEAKGDEGPDVEAHKKIRFGTDEPNK